MISRLPLPLFLCGIVVISLLFSLSKGSSSTSLYQLMFSDNLQFQTIFFDLRLPRTLSAFTCGALLALAGTLMQLLLQNPLADPYALGLSGGAAFFTLLIMMLGGSALGAATAAWGGSLLTICLMVLLARRHHWQTHTLLLSGIAIACAFSAGISALLLLSPDASLHSMLFWLSGDLNDASYPWAGILILIIGGGICLYLAPGFNILTRGESAASMLGLSTRRYRIALYLLSSLFTAAAVTIAGCIGFVGLIVPHAARMLTGLNHQRALPVSALLGGSLLTIADTLARSIIAPEQLPVGILTAIMGVPIFLWLLQK